MDLEELAATAAGVVAPVVALVAVALAVTASSTFSWASSALSDLGRPGTATATLFNAGLVAGGLLGLPFAVRLVRSRRVHPAPGVLFGLTSLVLALIGTFPIGHRFHYPVSAAFFVLVTVTLVAAGLLHWRSGGRVRGVIEVALGATNLLAWVAWWALLRDAVGIAAPETVGALVLAGWTAGTASWLLLTTDRGRVDRSPS